MHRERMTRESGKTHANQKVANQTEEAGAAEEVDEGTCLSAQIHNCAKRAAAKYSNYCGRCSIGLLVQRQT